jgi:hypothetical protein
VKEQVEVWFFCGTDSDVRRDSDVSVKSFSQIPSRTHIDVLVKNAQAGDREWLFTRFYGEPKRSARK